MSRLSPLLSTSARSLLLSVAAMAATSAGFVATILLVDGLVR